MKKPTTPRTCFLQKRKGGNELLDEGKGRRGRGLGKDGFAVSVEASAWLKTDRGESAFRRGCAPPVVVRRGGKKKRRINVELRRREGRGLA